MSACLRWLAGFVLLMIVGSDGWADVAPPCPFNLFVRRDRPAVRPLLDPEYDLVILSDPHVKQAELRVPRRMMRASASADISPRNAMAGLAICTAFVGGGLWCMRYRATELPKKKLLAAGVLLLILLAGLSLGHFVNADSPPQAQPMTVVPLPIQGAEIDVMVQIVDQGNEVQLIVPPALAEKIAAR